jgi:hypothetical protein
MDGDPSPIRNTSKKSIIIKTIHMKAHVYLFAALTLFSLGSCSFYTRINVKKAVDINPDDIREVRKVVILNRTGIPKGSKVTNVLEGVITGEMPAADKQGAEICVNGLSDCIKKSLNYTGSQVISVRMTGGATGHIPGLLRRETVDSICDLYQADMLVSLDFFDSNSGVSMAVTGNTSPGYASNTNNAVIKTTWRCYNHQTRQMVDDFTMQTYSNGAHYKSPSFIYNAGDKYSVVKNTGYWAGIEYGFRISEQYLLENRMVYRSGNSDMKAAGRLVRLNDWEQAMAVWDNQRTTSPKRRIRAKAAHNLAVYYEHIGNLDLAVERARESLTYSSNSATLAMMSALQRELNDRGRMISGSNQ